MRVTSRGVNLYGFIAIALMLVMVGVVFFRVVPRSWHFPLFAVALTLFMIRIALRLVLARQQRLEADISRPFPVHRGDDPHQCVIAALVTAGSFNRHDIAGTLDHAHHGAVP